MPRAHQREEAFSQYASMKRLEAIFETELFLLMNTEKGMQ
jgi:hypothetical protein